MYVIGEDAAIRVDLIKDPGEAELYSDILTRKHYLGSSAYNREQIVHVARQGRKDVAILTWDAATRHRFGMRDRLIGWTREQKEKRKIYCVENRRFLMLETGNLNLASHILGRSVARLSEDAQATWGHDVLLAETFIDTNRGLDGTCYKAAGWSDIGLTAGGHGKETWSRKRYIVKELKGDALAKLKAPELSPSDTTNPRQRVLFLEQLDVAGLKRRLEEVPDYRKYVGKYQLVPTLALIIAAVLCGAKDAKAVHRWISALSIEFLKSLGFRQAPSYCMLWRVITQVSAAALQHALVTWLTEQTGKLYVCEGIRQLCLDGKTLRAASKAGGSKLHLVTMIEATSRTVLDQRMTDDKSNEIPKVQEILKDAPIDSQTLVTADALNTQTETARDVEKKTVTTYLPLKETRQTWKRQSLKRPRRNNGLNRTLRELLSTDG